MKGLVYNKGNNDIIYPYLVILGGVLLSLLSMGKGEFGAGIVVLILIMGLSPLLLGLFIASFVRTFKHNMNKGRLIFIIPPLLIFLVAVIWIILMQFGIFDI